MVTTEKRREYMRQWRKANKAKIKTQEKNAGRRKALADMQSITPLGDGVYLFKTKSGKEFVIRKCVNDGAPNK